MSLRFPQGRVHILKKCGPRRRKRESPVALLIPKGIITSRERHFALKKNTHSTAPPILSFRTPLFPPRNVDILECPSRVLGGTPVFLAEECTFWTGFTWFVVARHLFGGIVHIQEHFFLFYFSFYFAFFSRAQNHLLASIVSRFLVRGKAFFETSRGLRETAFFCLPSIFCCFSIFFFFLIFPLFSFLILFVLAKKKNRKIKWKVTQTTKKKQEKRKETQICGLSFFRFFFTTQR